MRPASSTRNMSDALTSLAQSSTVRKVTRSRMATSSSLSHDSIRACDGNSALPEALTAASVATKPDNIHCILYRAWCKSAAMFFSKEDDLARFPTPAPRSEADIRRRIHRQAYVETRAAAFLTALPSGVSRTYDKLWAKMPRRDQGVCVFDDTAPLRCTEFNRPKDHLGDHGADLCKKVLDGPSGTRQ